MHMLAIISPDSAHFFTFIWDP